MAGRQSHRWMALIVGAVVALGACTGSSSPSASSSAPAAASTEASPAATPAPTPEPIRVGLVADVGGLKDRGYNQMAWEGVQRAMKELGVEGKVLEAKSDADYLPSLSQLADEGFDLVISVGFTMTDAMTKVAKAYPDQKFAMVDSAFDPAIPNGTSMLFREQDGAFLAGYLAGLLTEGGYPRTNDQLVVSTVGLVKIPPVDRYLGGFLGGAKYANPNIKVLNSYSQDFVDAAKCKEIALEQIAAGSDVFLTGAPCGFGAYDAAAAKNVWAVSGDVDLTYIGPQMLTSAQKRVDVAVFLTVKSVIDGTFAGGKVSEFGLYNGGVALGPVSAEIPAELVAKTKEIEAKIASGEIVPPESPEEVQ